MTGWNRWQRQAVWNKVSGGGSSPPIPTYGISGVLNNERDTPLVGKTITLNTTGTTDALDSTVTIAGGAYAFTGVVAGSYDLLVDDAPYEGGATVHVVAANVTQDFQATNVGIIVSGYIVDAGDNPIEGVLVSATGNLIDTDTTDAAGYYEFTTGDATFTLTPTKDDYEFAPASREVVVFGAAVVEDDFVGTWLVYTISGDIVDGAAAGIEGVTVTLSGDADDTDTTDVNGHYEFTGLVDGSYTVTPTKDGAVFTPTSRAAEVSGDNVVVDDMVGSSFIVWNAEGQTIGQQLNNVTSATGDAIRAVDYGTLPAMSPANFSNCWWGETPASTTFVEVELDLGSGIGVVPSADETIKIEAVFCMGTNTNAGFNIYLNDLVSSPQERIRFAIDPTNMQFLTYHATSGSSLYSVAHGVTFATNPSWMYFQATVNFATNVVTMRIVELDAAPQDSGVKTSGSLSLTCDQATELKVIYTSNYTTAAGVDQGLAQLWFSKDGLAFPGGTAKQSNFVPA